MLQAQWQAFMVQFATLSRRQRLNSMALLSGTPLEQMTPQPCLLRAVIGTSLLFLAMLGGLAAKTGGANIRKNGARVTLWSALSIALAVGVGATFWAWA